MFCRKVASPKGTLSKKKKKKKVWVLTEPQIWSLGQRELCYSDCWKAIPSDMCWHTSDFYFFNNNLLHIQYSCFLHHNKEEFYFYLLWPYVGPV